MCVFIFLCERRPLFGDIYLKRLPWPGTLGFRIEERASGHACLIQNLARVPPVNNVHPSVSNRQPVLHMHIALDGAGKYEMSTQYVMKWGVWCEAAAGRHGCASTIQRARRAENSERFVLE